MSPVCAVTRSMSVLPSVDVSKADSGEGKDAEFALMWPTDLVSVSRAEYVKDQNDDLLIKELFDQAVPSRNVGNKSGGYFLQIFFLIC